MNRVLAGLTMGRACRSPYVYGRRCDADSEESIRLRGHFGKSVTQDRPSGLGTFGAEAMRASKLSVPDRATSRAIFRPPLAGAGPAEKGIRPFRGPATGAVGD